MEASLAELVTRPFDRQRLIPWVEGIARRYDSLRRLAAAPEDISRRRAWMDLLFSHPGAAWELEHADPEGFELRCREAEEERARLVAQAPLPPAPKNDERVRPLAMAELEGVLKAMRHADRNQRRGVPLEPAPFDMKAALQIPRHRRRRAVVEALGRRYARPDLLSLLFSVRTEAEGPYTMSANEVKEGLPVRVEAFGRALAVVRHDGCVYAIDDTCPHRGGPLSKGELEDGHLLCPLHGWAFDLKTGHMMGNPAVSVSCYKTEERDEQVVLLPPGA